MVISRELVTDVLAKYKYFIARDMDLGRPSDYTYTMSTLFRISHEIGVTQEVEQKFNWLCEDRDIYMTKTNDSFDMDAFVEVMQRYWDFVIIDSLNCPDNVMNTHHIAQSTLHRLFVDLKITDQINYSTKYKYLQKEEEGKARYLSLEDLNEKVI